MKKVIAVLLAAIMLFAFAACGTNNTDPTNAPSGSDADSTAADTPTYEGTLRFTTGTETGTYYAFGSTIAQHASEEAKLDVVAVSSGGSKANIQALENSDAELGFCQSDVMTYAFEGTRLFETAVKNFSVVGELYTEQIQIVTTNPEIKTVDDLKGKNVSIGEPGSGTYFNAIDILEAYDLTEDDIVATKQSFGDSADSLKDGKIDAAFIVAGAPTTAITDLAASKDVFLVSLDDEHVAKLIETSPFYSKCTIAGGTYDKIKDDVITVGVGAVVLARNDVSEDMIYAFCADIYDNAPNLVKNHAKYGEVKLEEGASITSVPYHPGAVKYFADKGIDIAK